MNSKFLPYIALLLLLIASAGSWMHRKHLDNTLQNIREQIKTLDKRSIDPSETLQLKADLATCQEKLKRYE